LTPLFKADPFSKGNLKEDKFLRYQGKCRKKEEFE